MSEVINEEEVKKLAQQLRCPSEDEVCELMEESNANMIQQTIDLIDPNLSSLLELGPGNAHHLNELYKKSKCVVVADISEYVIQEISKKYSERVAASELKTVHTDGLSLNIANESIDGGFTVNTIYFWQDPKAYLKEIAKTLKKDAHFFITFAHRESVKDLPFVKYGFELYDEKNFSSLCEGSDLVIEELINKSENITSKLGDEFKRDFVIAKLRKL